VSRAQTGGKYHALREVSAKRRSSYAAAVAMEVSA